MIKIVERNKCCCEDCGLPNVSCYELEEELEAVSNMLSDHVDMLLVAEKELAASRLLAYSYITAYETLMENLQADALKEDK